MQKKLNIIAKLASAFMLLLVIGASAQQTAEPKEDKGMDFFHGTWAEAQAAAKEQNKYLVVDAFTTWCGPCKKMTRETFKDVTVGEFYNKNFINYKVDMEKGEGPGLKSVFKITAYPTLIYYNSDGTEVHRFKGYRPASAFLTEGKKALFNQDKLDEYAAQYKKGGSKDMDFVYDYINYMAIGGEIAEEPAKLYIKKNKKQLLKEDKHLELIFSAADDINSPLFDILCENKEVFYEKYGADAVNLRIRNAAGTVFLDAQKKKDASTIEKSIEAMKHAEFALQPLALLQMHLALYSVKEEWDAYYQTAADYMAENELKDPNFLNQIAWTVCENTDNQTFLAEAEQWARKSVLLRNQYQSNDTLAAILFKLGKTKEAVEVADMAIDLAKRTRQDYSSTTNLKEKYGY